MKTDSWTHHTQNFWWGCHKIAPECANCYIGPTMRRGGRQPFHGPLRTKDWRSPYRWNRAAAKAGQRNRVFTCSMSDFFHPWADVWREEAWSVIRDCSHLDWLILTKRIDQAADRLPHDWGSDGWPNVWLGVSCGCKASKWRVEQLSIVPAAVRFVSVEPLLESLELLELIEPMDWVIIGGESGPTRRSMQIAWMMEIYFQSVAYETPCYIKQDSAFRPGQQGKIPDWLWAIKQFPSHTEYDTDGATTTP